MNRTKADIGSATVVPAAMNDFGLRAAKHSPRSNAEIAGDFLSLSFHMESGRPLPVFSRFEEPVTVRVEGTMPPNAATDLSRLLNRFRNEAGIDIREVASGPANITVQFVSRQEIRSTYFNVACFVVPNVSSWSEFKAARNTGLLDWARVRTRKQVAVFLPGDSSAQEVRDCLHEEMAQGLGPLNDLYRLSNSVFNDDNFHTTLTGFDMTILRAYYAPELHSGMTEAQVAALLPGILARVNPAGGNNGIIRRPISPRIWINAIEQALGGNGSAKTRLESATKALQIAQQYGWNDGRLAFCHFAVGRLLLASDPARAMASFNAARSIYRAQPGGEIQAAHVDMQIAAYALASGDPARANGIAESTIPAVSAAENASLMATLLMMKAEALNMLGRGPEAQAARMDSRGWARYGFGSDEQIRARSAEISALAQRGNRS